MNEPIVPGRKLKGPRGAARLSILIALATLPLGCGGRAEMTLVDPGKFRFHTCAQLAREMSTLGPRAQELRVLYDKAARESTAVARIAYEADYLTTIGDMELIEAAAREKKCDPAIGAATQASAPAR